MRRRFVICWAGALAAGLLLSAWLVLREKSRAQAAGAGAGPQLVGFGLTKDAHFVFTGWVTNTGVVPIEMNACLWQCQDERGHVENAPRGWFTFHNWIGVTNFTPIPMLGGGTSLTVVYTLLPNGVATISFADVPERAKRVRLVFQYTYDAGALRREVSKRLGKLPLGSMSQRERYWLSQHGLLNGKYSRTYEGEWVSNESVQPAGASRRVVETNRPP